MAKKNQNLKNHWQSKFKNNADVAKKNKKAQSLLNYENVNCKFHNFLSDGLNEALIKIIL
jgi:hypothetical protein